MALDIGNNPLFELVYEEEKVLEGNIDDCKTFLKNDGVKLFHMNVCSINSKFSALHFSLV